MERQVGQALRIVTGEVGRRSPDVPARAHRWSEIRKVAQLARDIHTRKFKYYGQEATIVEAPHPRPFRRAYVETALEPPFALVRRKSVWELQVFGMPLGRVNAKGQVNDIRDQLSPISLSPSNIEGMAALAWSRFKVKVETRYAALCKEESHARRLYVDEGVGGYGKIRMQKLRGLAIRAVKAFSAHVHRRKHGR